MARKNYFAVVDKTTSRLVLLGAQLPIYWNEGVAQKVAATFNEWVVIPVSMTDINKSLTGQKALNRL